MEFKKGDRNWRRMHSQRNQSYDMEMIGIKPTWIR